MDNLIMLIVILVIGAIVGAGVFLFVLALKSLD